MPKTLIPREDLINLSNEQLRDKYCCTDRTIAKRRKEHGVVRTRSDAQTKPVPEEITAKWVRLYTEDMLTARAIKERFPDYGYTRIEQTLRERVGELNRSRRLVADGWCAS